MKKVILATIAMILFLSVKVFAYDDGDFQIWNTESEEMQLNKDLKLLLEQEFRWGDNAGELYYQHYDIGLGYKFDKNWSAAMGYRHVLSKNRGRFLVENVPNINLTFASRFAGLQYDTRSRLEYNHFYYKDDTMTYRNKFTVKFPWQLTKFQVQPYIADEIFVLFDDSQRLNKNRASAGLAFSLAKNLKGEVYYMLQSAKSNKWSKSNVLGTKLKMFF